VSDSDLRLPAFAPGMRIGLFGGSFDPPHEGHLAVTEVALKALRLDQVWWLISPHNPLKPNTPGGLAARIAAARALIDDPRIKVTGIEAALGRPELDRGNGLVSGRQVSFYTAETLRRLLPRLPGVHCVWMMGADNLASFHLWRDWRTIAASLPIVVFNRPGWALPALASPAAHTLHRWRLDPRDAPALAATPPPAWIFLPNPSVPASSTAIRGRRTRRVLKASP
jgi:nicotinate-nucleotide adenylyltransferase